jgi:hypothetical protein
VEALKVVEVVEEVMVVEAEDNQQWHQQQQHPTL